MTTTVYRPLSREELSLAGYQQDQLTHWEAVRDYARDYYGPAAARVEIMLESEYNDEGGYYYIIDDVQVYATDGEEIDPDVSLPKVREALDLGPEDTGTIKVLLDAWLAVRSDYWDELPRDEEDSSYDLSHPPTQRFPVVYVPVGEADAS